MNNFAVVHGPAIDTMKMMEGCSIDSVVTDPPYGLSKEPDIREVLSNWLADEKYEHRSAGFLGKKWDSFVPGPEYWREMYRVLKPGGHLLAFGGCRTFDMMTIAIRMAGFEIRDSIHWIYFSGFPKSTNISKAIVKVGESTPDEAEKWKGWGSALKPAHEPVIVARKPFEDPLYQNVLKHGTGALNIDGCRVAALGEVIQNHSQSKESAANPDGVYGDYAGMDTHQTEGQKLGRWPANTILAHSPDCVAVDTGETKSYVINRWDDGAKPFGGGAGHEFTTTTTSEDGKERFDVYECVDGCPAKMMNEQSRTVTSGPSRFFNQLNYTELDCEPFLCIPKAANKDKSLGMEGEKNPHPTVKPVSLMAHLCRLVTPPGGTVLDPFLGSGSTGVAAAAEGFRFIGIELEEASAATAQKRISWAYANPVEVRKHLKRKN